MKKTTVYSSENIFKIEYIKNGIVISSKLVRVKNYSDALDYHSIDGFEHIVTKI